MDIISGQTVAVELKSNLSYNSSSPGTYVYKVFEKATSDQSYNHKRNEMYNKVIEWMECHLFLGVVLD